MTEPPTVEQLAQRHLGSTIEEWQSVHERCEVMHDDLWPWIAQNAYDHGWSPIDARVWADTAFLALQRVDPAEVVESFMDGWCSG